MVAREWLKRGEVAHSPIDAFTDFWRGFNNLYGPGGAREIDRIKGYLSAHIPSAVASTIISSHPNQVAYLVSKPVIDMRGNGRDTAVAIADFKETGDPLERLRALFTIIYQVRCNLQHGQKSPTVDRDLRLCECSAPIVSAVVAHSV
jgi:hypothetical protein